MTKTKERKKKSKEAERRQTQCFMSAPAGAGRATERSARADPPLRARSPVGVPLTVLARGIFHPQRLSFRPGFLGGDYPTVDYKGKSPLLRLWGYLSPRLGTAPESGYEFARRLDDKRHPAIWTGNSRPL